MDQQSQSNSFVRLSNINVASHVERKGNFCYLSWPYAVSELRKAEVWRAAAETYKIPKTAVDLALAKVEKAKTELIGLAQHSSERSYGVSVCRFWKGRMNSKEEVRVTLTKQEIQ